MDMQVLIGQIAGRLAQGMRPDDPVTKRYLAVLAQLGQQALGKWAAVSAAGIRCNVQLLHRRSGHRRHCGEMAAGICVVCSVATCIDHALVSPRDGRIICESCVMTVSNAHVPSPESPVRDQHLRAKHLRTLQLDEDADADEIKHAYRELARKHHPDGKKGAAATSAEKRMRRINEAYEWLTKHNEEAAA
jgi:hypothetical protein